MPSLNIISCQTTIDDEDYFIPTEQPKNTEEIEQSFILAVEKSDNFKNKLQEDWEKYILGIDYENMTDEEKENEWIKYNYNSEYSQKDDIYMFWQTVYEYKIYQFNENYEKELESKNGKKVKLKALDKEMFKKSLSWALESVWINDKTKDQLNKMYDWAIQDNPNVSD